MVSHQPRTRIDTVIPIPRIAVLKESRFPSLIVSIHLPRDVVLYRVGQASRERSRHCKEPNEERILAEE